MGLTLSSFPTLQKDLLAQNWTTAFDFRIISITSRDFKSLANHHHQSQQSSCFPSPKLSSKSPSKFHSTSTRTDILSPLTQPWQSVSMAPSKTNNSSSSSSNRNDEVVAHRVNILASCYVVDSSEMLKGLHYSTTGADGMLLPPFPTATLG
jgi:hypothetical protein